METTNNFDMKIETDNLISVKTYADLHKITTQAVYLKIENGDIEVIMIDGKTFIQKDNGK